MKLEDVVGQGEQSLYNSKKRNLVSSDSELEQCQKELKNIAALKVAILESVKDAKKEQLPNLKQTNMYLEAAENFTNKKVNAYLDRKAEEKRAADELESKRNRNKITLEEKQAELRREIKPTEKPKEEKPNTKEKEKAKA